MEESSAQGGDDLFGSVRISLIRVIGSAIRQTRCLAAGTGHRDAPEWSADDGQRAETFYTSSPDSAGLILDLMIDHPGHAPRCGLDAEQIPTPATGANGPDRRHLVPGVLGELRHPKDAAERRYPFYWWTGQDGAPARYAMKPAIADLFRRARGTRAANAPAG